MGLLRRGDRRDFEDDFAAFYAARADNLRNTAYLLCGDWHLAQDLTQITFTKMYRVWQRIERHDTLDQYSRRVLVRTFLDERRRGWRREFATVPDSPELDAVARGDDRADERLLLRTALARVPKRQRAVLVLRFWMDMSVEQTAEALGCSTGTVKSQTASGLNNLRDVLGSELHDLKPPLRGGTS
jgi:RNA polymerase sigma-70 factor (sigma-E family)